MTVHCCVLCDAIQGLLSLGISNITRSFDQLKAKLTKHKSFQASILVCACVLLLEPVNGVHFCE